MNFFILEKRSFQVVRNKADHERIALRNQLYSQEKNSPQRFEARQHYVQTQ
jgi:hypothetical protein